ncbi:MAG: hypothetical protein COB04_02505 [Gammaproteobacteria bacterium]|nr:MAG: hypothetical protein COB04_02505 [Gammaproteobacteria bacterium]
MSPERFRHVVTLTVKDIPKLDQNVISELSVQSIIDGKLQAIPFQIDEYNQKSNFYYEGKEAPALGTVGVMDEKDELVFMYHDTGPKLTDQHPQSGTLMLELSFQDGDETRYAYVIKNSAERSTKKYVDYNVETGLIKSDYYTLEVDTKNPLNWKSHTYRTFNRDDSNIIDTLKIRISGELFGPWATLTLDNDNLKPTIIGVKHGPVRTIVKMDTRVSIAGIPVPLAKLMMHYYLNEQHLSAPVYADIPALGFLLRVIDKPSVSVSVDFNRLEGAEVYTAKGPKEASIVDGELSETEKLFDIAGVTGDLKDLSTVKLENNYLYMDTKRDYHILALLHIFPESLAVNDLDLIERSLALFGEDLGVLYFDDEKYRNKPEFVPGAHPEVGYDISLETSSKGEDITGRVEIRFAINLYFLDQIGTGGPEQFEQQVRNPPELAYRALSQDAVAEL